jgi:hypothetical protein
MMGAIRCPQEFYRRWSLRITSSCSGRIPSYHGAPHVRHFIMHTRRASRGSAPPLNCGVMRLS